MTVDREKDEAEPTVPDAEPKAAAEEPTAEDEPSATDEPTSDSAADDPSAAAQKADADERQSEPPDGGQVDETAAAEEVGVEPGTPEEPTPPRRRRRAAEVTAGTRPRPRQRAPRRDGQPPVEVRAQAKYVRTAPRKVRLVVDHIRGKSVDEARAILTHTTRGAAEDVLKLLNSCVANAENNHELVADELKVGRVYVDEGPTIKRFRPRALGRATKINKRTSHMTITLTEKE